MTNPRNVLTSIFPKVAVVIRLEGLEERMVGCVISAASQVEAAHVCHQFTAAVRLIATLAINYHGFLRRPLF